MPSAIQTMSRRYEFWKTPDDLQNAADRMSGSATWQLYAHEAESALTSCAVTRSYCRSAWVYASLTVSTIHRLMWLLMISLMLRFQCMNIHWRPPGFFQSPVCRASTVYRDIAFSPAPLDSSGQSQAPLSIRGPVSVADSSQGNQVPAVEIPQVVVACFLWRTHICQALYSMRAGTSAVLPKPMLTGTHISESAILGEWRHPRIPRRPHFGM